MNKVKINYLINISIYLILIVFLIIINVMYIKVNNDYKYYVKSNEKVLEEILNSEREELSHIGKYLYLQNIEYYRNNTENNNERERVWLILDELGCSPCQNVELSYIKQVQEIYGKNKIGIVVKYADERYVRNLVKINRFECDIIKCNDDQFYKVNKINRVPMIILTDSQNKILSCHCPIVGKEVFTKIYYEEYIVKYFNNKQ